MIIVPLIIMHFLNILIPHLSPRPTTS